VPYFCVRKCKQRTGSKETSSENKEQEKINEETETKMHVVIVDLAFPLDILLLLIIPIMDVLDFLLLIMGVEVVVGVHVVRTVLLLQVATLQVVDHVDHVVHVDHATTNLTNKLNMITFIQWKIITNQCLRLTETKQPTFVPICVRL